MVEKTEKAQEKDAVSEAEEKQGEEMMEKILSALKTGEVPNVVQEIKSENKEAEYLEKIARQQADFDNFRKRMEKDKQEILINGNANLLSQILPVIDHFELALKHNKDKGIQMIYDELNEILEKVGVKVVETKGTFNPKVHEAVITVAGDEDGKILEEIQKGYLLNERLLRASKVKVMKVTNKK